MERSHRKIRKLLAAGLLALTLGACAAPGEAAGPSPVPTTPPTVPAAAAPAETTAPTEQTVPPTEETLPTLRENPYGEADFGWKNGFLTCLGGGSVLGVDVSAYQSGIDWEAVRETGVEFVMLRAGFRGYGNGALKTDPAAEEHYRGAKAAGLKVGAYFFSQAVSVEEAREEAEYLLDIIGEWQVDLPVAFDWEYISDTARTADVDSETLAECAAAFCAVIREAGFRPMVYFSPEQDRLFPDAAAGYGVWAAEYGDGLTLPYLPELWQYTNAGHVPGIPGNVDIDLWFPE